MIADTLTWTLAGISAIVVGGTLLHFCFEWVGRRRVFAVIAPVNESVWEHLKMAYWPLVAVTAVQVLVGDGAPGLPAARAAGFGVMAALMLGLYFITATVLPKAGLPARLAMDGTNFVISVTAGQLTSHALISRAPAGVAGSVLLLLPAAVLAVTTFAPPRREIFRDQVTGGYGVSAGARRS